MITVNLSESQAKLIEDALAMLAVSYPGNNEACVDAYKLVIDARHNFLVKKMIEENPSAGSDWHKEIA